MQGQRCSLSPVPRDAVTVLPVAGFERWGQVTEGSEFYPQNSCHLSCVLEASQNVQLCEKEGDGIPLLKAELLRQQYRWGRGCGREGGDVEGGLGRR